MWTVSVESDCVWVQRSGQAGLQQGVARCEGACVGACAGPCVGVGMDPNREGGEQPDAGDGGCIDMLGWVLGSSWH
eukprot:344326-Chlamydomonas_euryale.AAC.1